MPRPLPLVAVLCLSACGLPDSRLLSKLDDAEKQELCAELAAEPRTAACTIYDSTFELVVTPDEASCVDSFPDYPEGCIATVGDVRACNEAKLALTDEEVCSGAAPEACLATNDLSCLVTPPTPPTN